MFCLFQTYINTSLKNGDNKDEFQCPVCRENVKTLDPTKPREKWAKLFPKNRLLISLFDSEPQRSECCRVHPSKLIEVFCDTHTEIGCSTCLLTRHKGCEITSLEDFIKGGKFKRSCSKDNELLLQYRKLFETTINQINENIDKLNKAKANILEQVKATRVKIDEILKCLEEKLIDVLHIECQREIEKLKEQIDRCSHVIQDINKTMEQVKTAQTDINQVHVYYNTTGSLDYLPPALYMKINWMK